MPNAGINHQEETDMTLKSAIAAALIAFCFSVPAWADVLPCDAPYFETDSAGRGLMP